MPRSATVAAFLILLSGLQGAPIVAQEEPLPTDLKEEVEVRFVTIDALVLDAAGRVVTDLTRDDFELHLDLVPHRVVSADLDCPGGEVQEPVAVELGRGRAAPPAPEVPSRFALIVDYRNMRHTLRVEVVERLQEMLRANHVPGEELMLAAVTRRLRVEQSFTDDVEAVVAALERMKNDPSLWQLSPVRYLDRRERLHEFEILDAVLDVMDLMSDYEGRQAIVLFSDLPTKVEDAEFQRFLASTPAAFDYDPQFQALSMAAMEYRIPVYPVETRGLTRRSPSARLARLAVETGGRFSPSTNDLSLAWVRARRDIACRYRIGFYDTPEHPGRMRRINLKSRRPGLRVHHPVHYRFGVEREPRRSWSETAYTAPAPFRDDAVRGQVFPVRPATARRWQAVVALSFSVAVPGLESRLVRFGAKLDDGERRAVHAFDSEMTILGAEMEQERQVVVLEPAILKPGDYELSVVVDDPIAGLPLTAVSAVGIPPLAEKGLVVAHPLLLSEARRGVTVSWNDALLPLAGGGDEGGLEPVLPGQAVGRGPLTAVTHVCWAGGGRQAVRVEVERWIRSPATGASRRLLPITVELRGGGAENCQRVAAAVPIETLTPGEYECGFRFRGPGDEPALERRVAFRVAEREAPTCAE